VNPYDDADVPLPYGRLLAAAKRRAWVIVLMMVIGGVVAHTVSKQETPQYRATASLYFNDEGLDKRLFGSTYTPFLPDPDREAATRVLLVDSADVGRTAARRLRAQHRARLSTSEVMDSVSVVNLGNANFVTVTATRPSATEARDVANAFAAAFISTARGRDAAQALKGAAAVQRQVDRLRSRGTGTATELAALSDKVEQLRVIAAVQNGNVQVAQPAVAPLEPSTPETGRDVMAGIIIGLLLGILAAVALERRAGRIVDAEQAGEVYDLPVLALLPTSASLAEARDPEHGEHGEALRFLRARIDYADPDHRPGVVLVTSAVAGEGASTVAYGLARAAAQGQAGRRVALLEMDLRRPSIGQRIGVARPALGLTDLLSGRATFDDVCQRLPVGGAASDASLVVITAGSPPASPGEVGESDEFRKLLGWLRGRFDQIVIDAPPLGVVSDAVALLARADAVVVVARMNVSRKDEARALMTQLRGLHRNVLGVVCNEARLPRSQAREPSRSTRPRPPARKRKHTVVEWGRRP
jgi:non-specific protein-tyrosine kinase